MVGGPDFFRNACAVDISFSERGSNADGKLFKSAAVTAHGVAFEMGKNEKGIVINNVFADKVFLDNFSVGDLKFKVRAFCVKKINREIFVPAVFFKSFKMLFGGVAGAFISGVAFGNGSVYFFDKFFPEFRMKEVLVSGFSGMNFNGNFSGKFRRKSLINFHKAFGADIAGKINFCFFHKNTSRKN